LATGDLTCDAASRLSIHEADKAFDNGQRSPRTLLAAVVRRLMLTLKRA
jgi:hypothetical protein